MIYLLYSFSLNGVNDAENGTDYPSAALGTGKGRGSYITGDAGVAPNATSLEIIY